MPIFPPKSTFLHNHGATSHDESSIKDHKSFLNFMNKRYDSSESLRSDQSAESIHSAVGGRHAHGGHHHGEHESLSSSMFPGKSHSMTELKKFFRLGFNSPYLKASAHPTPSISPPFQSANLKSHEKIESHHAHTQSAFPPALDSTLSLSNRVNIYQDDSILAQKYGKFGKLLGAGAGGSVKVITRPSDGATFAVKEFRERKPTESSKEYAKKCTAEYLIGSTLHHPNIIETLDIFADSRHNKYFEVMQYCPVDFFGVVMSGKMSRSEINCCIKQLADGVRYLHKRGLAHRDLKLDNCVMNEDGVLKIIDFGSAVIFKYPFEEHVAMAHGIVGSDPYLAPEVVTSTKSYDPQYADVWSIAIMYCCIMLKRFPWKAPHYETDENFRLFVAPDDEPHDYYASASNHTRLLKEREIREHEQQQMLSDSHPLPTPQQTISVTEHDHTISPELSHNNDIRSVSSYRLPDNSKIHGPYRLLRLLPHLARPILSKMLLVDPEKRASLDDLFNDEWFASLPCCTMDKNGKVRRAVGHHHTIVKEVNGRTETYRI